MSQSHERLKHLPHEVDVEACAELDEDFVHIAEVGSVAMGEEHGEAGPGATHVHRDDLRAPPRPHPPCLHAHTPPHARHHHPPRSHLARILRRRRRRGIRPLSGTRRRRRFLLLVDHAVRRRVRREERHLGGHRGSNPAHLQPQASGRSGIRVFSGRGGVGGGGEGLQLQGQILLEAELESLQGRAAPRKGQFGFVKFFRDLRRSSQFLGGLSEGGGG